MIVDWNDHHDQSCFFSSRTNRELMRTVCVRLRVLLSRAWSWTDMRTMNEDSEEGTSFPWNSDQLHDMDRGEFQHESDCSEFKDEEVFESDHDENLIYISETMFSMSDREHDDRWLKWSSWSIMFLLITNKSWTDEDRVCPSPCSSFTCMIVNGHEDDEWRQWRRNIVSVKQWSTTRHGPRWVPTRVWLLWVQGWRGVRIRSWWKPDLHQWNNVLHEWSWTWWSRKTWWPFRRETITPFWKCDRVLGPNSADRRTFPFHRLKIDRSSSEPRRESSHKWSKRKISEKICRFREHAPKSWQNVSRFMIRFVIHWVCSGCPDEIPNICQGQSSRTSFIPSWPRQTKHVVSESRRMPSSKWRADG